MAKTIYYSDEMNDDFAKTKIKKRALPKNYKFFRNDIFFKLRRFLLYRLIVTPLIYVYNKLVAHMTFKNKKVMRGYKNRGCFIYGNHTAYADDAFKPTYISFPRPADVVVNSDATSIKGLRWLVTSLGAMPIPDNFHQMKKFNEDIERAIKAKHWIAIYPEAHIWPYYTGIRNFPSVSFKYPAMCGAPVFAYTTVYTKRRFSNRPKITVYIDGPFFADSALPVKAAAQKLRDEVYEAMCARAALSDCSYVEYIYRPVEVEEEEEEQAATAAV